MSVKKKLRSFAGPAVVIVSASVVITTIYYIGKVDGRLEVWTKVGETVKAALDKIPVTPAE